MGIFASIPTIHISSFENIGRVDTVRAEQDILKQKKNIGKVKAWKESPMK